MNGQHEKIVTWQTTGPHVIYQNAPWQASINLRRKNTTAIALTCHACCPVHMAEEIGTAFSELANQLPVEIDHQKELSLPELSDSEKEHLSENS